MGYMNKAIKTNSWKVVSVHVPNTGYNQEMVQGPAIGLLGGQFLFAIDRCQEKEQVPIVKED